MRTPSGESYSPHEDFVSKINAIRYAFLELGMKRHHRRENRLLGAGLTQKIPGFYHHGTLGVSTANFWVLIRSASSVKLKMENHD
ncbi:MAG: hypothetical protein Ct9H90mP27_3730 [Gammaproteobacteria bacterium]|nr:MAG: hypothetical protein Ct9H90mP27_3730 [Gammaproteobacteria bacterium]